MKSAENNKFPHDSCFVVCDDLLFKLDILRFQRKSFQKSHENMIGKVSHKIFVANNNKMFSHFE